MDNMNNRKVLPNDFDLMYSNNDDKLLELFIKKKLDKFDIKENGSLIPKESLIKKIISIIILSIVIFIFVSSIFFHFTLIGYILEFIILFILVTVRVLVFKFDLINYLIKKVKSNPSGRIEDIILSTKNSFVNDKSRLIGIVAILMAIILPLIIFINPIIFYKEVDRGYMVKSYAFGLTNFETITIPNSHKNKPVVAIYGSAFNNMPFLKKATLPDSVTYLEQTFYNCKNLEEIKLPSELTKIGFLFCYNCNSLKSIDIPNSVTSIDSSAFENATNLKEVKLSSNIETLGGFINCKSLTSIDIPDSLEEIDKKTFSGAENLTTVNISKNSKLYEIQRRAFSDCPSLKEITLPADTDVYPDAFKNSPTIIKYYESNNNNNHDEDEDR